MSKLSVYLAGAISEVPTDEARHWRDEFIAEYGDRLEIFDPHARDEGYSDLTGSELFSAIADGERMDILNSDATIAYVGTSSMGTAMGIMYAYLSGRTVVIVKDPPERKLSKMVLHHNHRVCTLFHEAVEFLESRHSRNTIKTIKKRNGTQVAWNPERIHNAIQAAVDATSSIYDRTKRFEPPRVEKLVTTVIMQIEDDLSLGKLSYDDLDVEQVQDMVEKVLMDNAHRDEVHTFAKEYIIYRRQQKEIRDSKWTEDEIHKFIIDTIHDFKSPAGNLEKYVDWLEKGIKANNPHEIEDNLNQVKKIQADLMKKIHQRRADAKKQFQKISADLCSFVQKEFQLYRKENCHFHNNIAEGLAVEIYSNKLQTILRNLIENSLKHGFGDEKGDIYIEAEPLNENNILIRYWNSGNEITNIEASRMFFEKKKPSSSPNSFQHGMLQVSRYVEDMGGTIKCIVKKDDEEDREIYKGIPVFRFALPAGKEVQKRTILVADDNQGDREMMQKILTRAGMRVLMAEKPEEALTIAQNETIHGAVVDIDFEDEHNGIWLLRKLKELKPEVIKIVVSGAESSFPENWQDDARKYGAAQIYDKAQYRAEHIIQHFEI